MKLNQKQIKYLRSLGHALSPIVTVADRGLVDTVVEAIDEALDIHELVKVKIRHPREDRAGLCDEICKKTGAVNVQTIGMILLIYRPKKKPVITLPGQKASF